MKNHLVTRRSFLGLAAAGVAVLARPGLTRAASVVLARDPDLIVVNGKVYTVDSRQPRAQAFAVKDGRFVAVGSTADIRALAGKNTQVFDAGQMSPNYASGRRPHRPTPGWRGIFTTTRNPRTIVRSPCGTLIW
jgi:hypothetical protein